MDIDIKRKNTKFRKYGIIFLIIITIIGIVTWSIVSSGISSYATEQDSLIISEVEEGAFDDFIRVNGRVETGVVVQVSALETGIVEKKWVEEGEMVREGDIILSLHNPNLRQQILDSESHLAEKQNMLRDTEIAMEKEQMQVKQDLLGAKTDLNRKRRIAEQQSTLYKENLTSKEEFLKSKEDYELAMENYNLLQNRLRQDSLYRSVQIEMMRESLRNMQENFEIVRQRADNLNVRATHSGQLGNLEVELGQNIVAGQQVGQINILDNYKLTVNIDEHYIDRVVTGLKGVARRQNQEVNLNVKKVYPEVKDGVFKADLIINGNEPEKIRVGQTYPIDLILSEPSKAILIPRGPFFQKTGGNWIYVMDKDGRTAYKRKIKIGRQNPKYYEVIEGLSPGEKVIVSTYANFDEVDKIMIKDISNK